MTLLAVDPERPLPEAIERAAAILRRGGLVAFPTETVYGLGANALDPDAVAKIFGAKERPRFNPLIVHLADAEDAADLVTEWPEMARRLAAAFWPGPLTLILPKRALVPDAVTAGLPSVALRVPRHPVARALLRAASLPVAAPSANRFTRVSPTTAAHVQKGLGDRIDLILDGGPTAVGIESTVIDLSAERPRLLRPGSVGIAELERVVGPVVPPGAEPFGSVPRPSPGMTPRHYAPRARVRTFAPSERAGIARELRDSAADAYRVGALLLGPLDAPVAIPIPMPPDPDGYARRLYAALHELDEQGCDLILIERVPDSAEWAGIRDRLERAARAP